MKNKNLKTIFSGLIIAIAIILITLTNFWADLNGVLSGGQVSAHLLFCLWTASDTAKHLLLNWKLAWIFFVLLLAGIALVVANFIMFTLPNKNKISFAFDILTVLGFVMVFIGMFIPYGIKVGAGNITHTVEIQLSATQIFMYVGSPLALAMSFISVFLVKDTNTSIPCQPSNNF